MKITNLIPESFLVESSEAIKFMKDEPGGLRLAKAMHDRFKLDPNQKFERVQKLNWTDIKGGSNSRYNKRDFIGTWVVMLFKQGAAAILFDQSSNEYKVLVADPETGEIAEDNFSSSKSVGNFIKRKLDMPKLLASKAKIYMGNVRETNKIPKTGWRRSTDLELTPVGYKNWQKKVAANKADPSVAISPGGTKDVEQAKVTGRTLAQYRKQRQRELDLINKSNPEKLVERFKPLWLKYAKLALADINGIIQTMAKSGAYERLKEKITRNVEPLDNIITRLETVGHVKDRNNYSYGNSATSYLNSAIKRAVALASVYYYPDETGNVNQNGEPDNKQGVAMLMSDIDRGDMTKLKTVLDYFKQELMRVPR